MKIAPPSELLNLTINVLAFALFGGSLYIASHTDVWWHIALCAVVFSYVANTIFAFLHEAVHRVYSWKPWLNETMGVLNGALFPTGLTFQRVCHLGHHLRNRTDHEMFDMYYPNDNLFLKNAQFYSILTGVYWLTIPIGWGVYLLCPWSYRLLKTENVAIQHTGAIMLHPFIDHPKKWRIRFELIFVIALQVSLFHLLELKFWPTLLCYWIFGMVWGSLQYADHAWSARDVLKGAWNLKVNPITRFFFLNYHYHQVHHMNPKLPWNHLPRHIDASSPQPSFWKIYFEMWKGPRPADAPNPKPVAEVVNALSDDEDLDITIPVSEEWECFKQFVLFTKRHRRYGTIAVILYALSFKNWSLAKRLRHGFCALQLIDDLLDGDRACAGEPSLIIERAMQAVVTNKFDQSDLQRLLAAYLSQTRDEEIRQLVQSVTQAMMFDRRRVKEKLALTAEELKRQHHHTFSTSLDLVLATMKSSLRTKDAPAVLDVFAWCSMWRDLEEDIGKGLVNIPREIWPSETPSVTWVRDPKVEAWVLRETQLAMLAIDLAEEQLARLPDESGKKVFRIFLRSMRRYAKKVPNVPTVAAV